MAEMRMENARDPEQLRRMQELAEKGECHFCIETYTKNYPDKILYGNAGWYVVQNDFVYSEGVHHYLIVSKTHLTKVTQLGHYAKLELFYAIEWLERHLNADGASIFVRSGDMARTGATLDHLHLHFLYGEKAGTDTEKVKVTLAYAKKEPQE